MPADRGTRFVSDARPKTFMDFRIEVDPGRASGDEVRAKCPECGPARKKPNIKSMNVNVREGVWFCHHCGWKGSLRSGVERASDPSWWVDRDRPREWTRPRPLVRDVSSPADVARREWSARMADRGITPEVMVANGVDVRRVWFPQIEGEAFGLAYPYYRQGELVNVKYRHADKHFRMEKDAEKILWRLDAIADPADEEVVICEGENDCLALEVAGIHNATSVPNGAPAVDVSNYDGALSYLEDPFTAGVLARKRRIVLATDGDRPGVKLRDELARRFGPERCLVVSWPEGCKDANEVLQTKGADVLRAVIRNAEPMPLAGVLSVPDFRDAMDEVYRFGFPPGPSTGWSNLDRMRDGRPLYRPSPGLLSIVTGVPGSGKSRWVNALAVNLARVHGWRFGICSPEYQPTELLTKHLAECYIGKTMDVDAPNRMSAAEYEAAMRWVGEHFYFIVPETTTAEEILDRSTALIARYGIRGLIIDPWTEVEMAVGSGGSNDVRILQVTLATIQKFLRAHLLHVWICAHPVKLENEGGTDNPRVVGMYDIAGGAQFGNKADFIVSIWRDKLGSDGLVDIHIKKSRFQHLGNPGQASLTFEPVSGRYRPFVEARASDGADWEEAL